ncbi:acyl-CoA dehydrogenase family protein, partial [uncultured Tepidimonas sp.]|uniref:acyl-CoA dehydrogenase family protein n=1 Tax=uncultured Tepidimonas sp. TaxID=453579 RepID=UPI002634D929
MDFSWTDDQRMLADSLQRYLAQRYPLARRHAASASPLGYDAQAWRELVELGAVAALLPPQVGGLGGGGFDIMTVFECVGRALVVEPLLGSLVVGQMLAHADAS